MKDKNINDVFYDFHGMLFSNTINDGSAQIIRSEIFKRIRIIQSIKHET